MEKSIVATLKEAQEFRYLWIGYTLTIFGGWFATIAVNLYVWNSYESMILSSISLVINMIPTVFLGPLLGGVVDRINKKRLAILLTVLNGAVLIIPVLFKNIYALCTFNFLAGVVSCMRYPWINSYIPDIVGKEDLINANSLASFSKTSGQLLMPLLSGFLLMFASSTVLYLLNIGFLVLAFLAFSRLSFIKGKEEKRLDEKKEMLDILTIKKVLFERKTLSVVLIILSLLFLDGAMDLLLVAETKNIHQKTDFYYGLVTTIKGIGMALASVGAYQWLSKIKKDDIQVLYFLGLVKILFTFLMGNVHPFSLFVVIVFWEAYFWISITIIEKNVMQTAFPASYRGKIFAFYGSACWLASSAGTLFFGLLAEKMVISKAITVEVILVLVVWMAIHRFVGGAYPSHPK